MSRLKAFQKVLLINWVVVPVLILSVWIKIGFPVAVAFFLAWLATDWLWDCLTTALILSASKTGNDEAKVGLFSQGEVTNLMAVAMLTDLVGTLIVPWVIWAILILAWPSMRILSFNGA